MRHSKIHTSINVLSIAAILSLAVPVSASDTSLEEHEPISIKDNAALWYWVAFSELGDMDTHGLYKDWPPTIEIDKVRSTLVDSQFNVLTYLHRGTRQPACAWGVDVKAHGVYAILPQLGQARKLARMAGVRAEYYFQQDDIDSAADDLIASFVLSRHISVDGLLIDVLVQISMSQITQQVLVENLYRFDRPQLLRLQEQLSDLPPRRTIAESFTMEKYLVEWMRTRVRESGIESFRDVFDEDVFNQDDLTKLVEQSGSTIDGFERLAAQTLEYYDQMQRITTLNYDELDDAEDALFEKMALEGNNRLALTLLPAGSKARQSELRHEALTTMLHAMIAYQIDGPEAYRQITDPYDGQPFEMEATEAAVVLRSRMPAKDGNPISVEFPSIKLPVPSDQP